MFKLSNLKKLLQNYEDRKCMMIGKSHMLNIRDKYNSIQSLGEVEYKVFSQFGEDGILDYILKQLNIINPKFVEIGVGDYSESNTRFLYANMHGKGLIIDCLKDLKNKVSKNVKLWRGHLTILEEFINSENINKLLEKNNFDHNIDLFSIDIDGIDYWILDKMPDNFSKICVIEYNATFGSELEITVPNIKTFNRTNYHYSNLCYGMSLKALIKLMDKKNFYFIGTNLAKHNAFFISKRFSKEFFFKNLIIQSIKECINSNIRESINKNGNLNYLSGKKKLLEIEECEVIDLSSSDFKKIKIKDLVK